MGGVSVVLRPAAVLHRVSLAALQSETRGTLLMSKAAWSWALAVCSRSGGAPGHGLDLQPLLDAVGQRLLVVVFADAGQDPLLVGLVLVPARVDLT